MMTAQWAKGHGGLYRYYRCSRKANRPCIEPYVREGHLSAQCLERLRPLALSASEAEELRSAIEQQGEQEQHSLLDALQKADEALQPLEDKLRKLTRCLLDDIIDEDSYRAAKEDLVLEKTRLKQERQRLHKTRESYWIEPAQRLVEALETLGKMDSAPNVSDISALVQKIGTNHLISRKTATFSFSEDYDFIPSLLASVRVQSSDLSASPHSEKPQSIKWCPG